MYSTRAHYEAAKVNVASTVSASMMAVIFHDREGMGDGRIVALNGVIR